MSLEFATFSDGTAGGNPASVVIADSLSHKADMQRVAAEIGYAETVFASPERERAGWRVRYLTSATEVAPRVVSFHGVIRPHVEQACIGRRASNQAFCLV